MATNRKTPPLIASLKLRVCSIPDGGTSSSGRPLAAHPSRHYHHLQKTGLIPEMWASKSGMILVEASKEPSYRQRGHQFPLSVCVIADILDRGAIFNSI